MLHHPPLVAPGLTRCSPPRLSSLSGRASAQQFGAERSSPLQSKVVQAWASPRSGRRILLGLCLTCGNLLTSASPVETICRTSRWRCYLLRPSGLGQTALALQGENFLVKSQVEIWTRATLPLPHPLIWKDFPPHRFRPRDREDLWLRDHTSLLLRNGTLGILSEHPFPQGAT